MSTNLQLIKTTRMTDDVQTVNITNVFSSKYDVYMIKGSNFLGNNSTATGLNLRLINSSDSVITSGYSYAQNTVKGDTSTFSENNGTSEDRIWNVFGGLHNSGRTAGNIAYIFNPFLSKYTFTISQGVAQPSGNFRMYKGIGLYPQTTVITGIQVELNESASRFSASGIVSVYGVK